MGSASTCSRRQRRSALAALAGGAAPGWLSIVIVLPGGETWEVGVGLGVRAWGRGGGEGKGRSRGEGEGGGEGEDDGEGEGAGYLVDLCEQVGHLGVPAEQQQPLRCELLGRLRGRRRCVGRLGCTERRAARAARLGGWG